MAKVLILVLNKLTMLIMQLSHLGVIREKYKETSLQVNKLCFKFISLHSPNIG